MLWSTTGKSVYLDCPYHRFLGLTWCPLHPLPSPLFSFRLLCSNAWFWKNGSRTVVQQYHESMPLNEQCYPGGFTYSWRLLVPPALPNNGGSSSSSLTVEIFRFFVPVTAAKTFASSSVSAVKARGLLRTLAQPNANVATSNYRQQLNAQHPQHEHQPHHSSQPHHSPQQHKQHKQQQQQQQQQQQSEQQYNPQYNGSELPITSPMTTSESIHSDLLKVEQQRNLRDYYERGGVGVRGVLGVGGGVGGYKKEEVASLDYNQHEHHIQKQQNRHHHPQVQQHVQWNEGALERLHEENNIRFMNRSTTGTSRRHNHHLSGRRHPQPSQSSRPQPFYNSAKSDSSHRYRLQQQ